MPKLKFYRPSIATLSKFLACFCLAASVVPAPAPSPTGTPESTNKYVHVVTRKEGDVTKFFVENLESTEVTATFDFQLTNLKSSGGSSYTATYPPKKVTEAVALSPIRTDKQWSYNYVNHFTIGSTKAIHDDSVIYALPFAPGAEYKVTQGFNGSYSHSGADQYAIDWKMPCGSAVHAARAGVVAKVKVDSAVGGPDRKFEDKANYILIRHSDGTLANYAHLSKNGAEVKPGQIVEAGDLIGYSGNTGFTSGPHLHFSVFKTKTGKQRLSIPVKFQIANTHGINLVEGKTYKRAAAAKTVAKAPAVNLPPVSVAPARASKATDGTPAAGGAPKIGDTKS